MDAATRERARARVLLRLVEAASQRAPLLVVVEDIHWADVMELAQLADLAAALARLPVLLTLSTRVDGDPTGPGWRARARGCPVTTLDLAPLADDEARDLAARYGGLPATILEECLEKAAGHPLFLDQLLRTAQSGQTTLPGSVRGLVLARHRPLAARICSVACTPPRFSARDSPSVRCATCSRSRDTTRAGSSRPVSSQPMATSAGFRTH